MSRRSPARRRGFVIATLLGVLLTLEGFSCVAEQLSETLLGPFDHSVAFDRYIFAPGEPLRHDGATSIVNEGLYIGPYYPKQRSAEHRDEVLRIVALGDSTTFGWGLPPEQAWPAQLEVKLRARGENVEVLNFGVFGTNTLQHIRRWERHAAAFQPDLVLLGWYHNDALVDRGSPNIYRHCSLPAPRADRLLFRALEASALLRVLHDLVAIYRNGTAQVIASSDSDYIAGSFGYECALQWTAQLADLCHVAGAELLVLQVPNVERLREDAPHELAAQARLRESLTRLGLPSVDPAAAMHEAGADRAGPHNHPTARGNEIMAEELRRGMSSAGMLGSDPGEPYPSTKDSSSSR